MKKNFSVDNRSGERLSLRHVNQALAGIERVSAHIHRVKLSARVELKEVLSVLGKGKSYLSDDNKSHFMSKYNRSSYHVLSGYPVTLYSIPKQKFRPSCIMFLTQHDQDVLYTISKKIPSINVSSAEYAIDLFCKDKSSVSILFYVLRRYMYFPYRSLTSTVGGKFSGLDVERSTNCAYYVWQRAVGKKDIVVYERGRDSDAKAKVWPYEKIDRVRIEFLARTQKLKQLKINKLAKFVENNKFSDVVNKRFRFCVFKNSDILPGFGDDYSIEDAQGNIESFQEAVAMARSNTRNINQYIKQFVELDKLKEKIDVSCQEAEAAWRNCFRKKFI